MPPARSIVVEILEPGSVQALEGEQAFGEAMIEGGVGVKRAEEELRRAELNAKTAHNLRSAAPRVLRTTHSAISPPGVVRSHPARDRDTVAPGAVLRAGGAQAGYFDLPV